MKAHSKNASLISSINQGSSKPFVEAEIFSTPKSVAKSKRPLLADSSMDESISDSKKIRYEDLSSFTDDPELSHLNSLSKETISSVLHRPCEDTTRPHRQARSSVNERQASLSGL
jgi:hypothetical protein